MAGDIRTPPANDRYRENFGRIFSASFLHEDSDDIMDAVRGDTEAAQEAPDEYDVHDPPAEVLEARACERVPPPMRYGCAKCGRPIEHGERCEVCQFHLDHPHWPRD